MPVELVAPDRYRGEGWLPNQSQPVYLHVSGWAFFTGHNMWRYAGFLQDGGESYEQAAAQGFPASGTPPTWTPAWPNEGDPAQYLPRTSVAIPGTAEQSPLPQGWYAHGDEAYLWNGAEFLGPNPGVDPTGLPPAGPALVSDEPVATPAAAEPVQPIISAQVNGSSSALPHGLPAGHLDGEGWIQFGSDLLYKRGDGWFYSKASGQWSEHEEWLTGFLPPPPPPPAALRVQQEVANLRTGWPTPKEVWKAANTDGVVFILRAIILMAPVVLIVSGIGGGNIIVTFFTFMAVPIAAFYAYLRVTWKRDRKKGIALFVGASLAQGLLHHGMEKTRAAQGPLQEFGLTQQPNFKNQLR